MNKIPYGSKPQPELPQRTSLWGSVKELIQVGIDRTTEVVEQDKARQKELSGLRALNAEFMRRKGDYPVVIGACIALFFAATIGITISIEPETWLGFILVGIIVGACLMLPVSVLMSWIEDKLIVRDTKRDGWPIPPK